ncbi:MAG: FCD domain-containing protein [Pseudomonadota bacterium]
MPFEKIETAKVSQSIIDQIERLILRGVLTPGERLPSERDLAARFGVSRPSVREAMTDLQAAGLVETRANAGIFVSDVLGSAFSPALMGLFARHDEAVFDYLSLRRDMEGLAAERAARHASDTDLAVITDIMDRMEAAHKKRSGDEEAALDAEFHLAIIEAAHNVVLLHLMRSVFSLLRNGVFYNRKIMFRQRATRESLLDQHRAIYRALMDRDPPTARQAVTDHLAFVESCLRDHRMSLRNESIARQRLDHATSR